MTEIQNRSIAIWWRVDQIKEEITGGFDHTGDILFFNLEYKFIRQIYWITEIIRGSCFYLCLIINCSLLTPFAPHRKTYRLCDRTHVPRPKGDAFSPQFRPAGSRSIDLLSRHPVSKIPISNCANSEKAYNIAHHLLYKELTGTYAWD